MNYEKLTIWTICLLITHNSFSLILLSLSCSYSHDPAHPPSCKLEMKIRFIVRGWKSIVKDKHCQRHNGPEGWVHLTKVTYWGHITSSNIFRISTKHQLLSQTSASPINLTFKILTKPSFRILTKMQLGSDKNKLKRELKLSKQCLNF